VSHVVPALVCPESVLPLWVDHKDILTPGHCAVRTACVADAKTGCPVKP
jgi:hypothetical protein